jgi:hypothetical protein
MRNAVRSIGTDVERQAVAPVLRPDSLGIGNSLGHHKKCDDIVGIVGHDRPGVDDVSGWHDKHVNGLLSRNATVRSSRWMMSADTSPAMIEQNRQSAMASILARLGPEGPVLSSPA